MCQLLGVSSNKPVNIRLSIREFKRRGKKNPHGWGFGFLDARGWQVRKDAGSLAEQDLSAGDFKFKSPIIVGHVRLNSCHSSQSHSNTHPFSEDSWIFAHNGTVTLIKTDPKFRLRKYKPKGETDSEYAFYYLLEKIESNPNDIQGTLAEEAAKIREYGNGNFNFLLSDGKVLYAYGDNRLHFVKRRLPFQQVTLVDEQYQCDLNEIKDPDEEAIIVATEPLTEGETWEKIEGLKVFQDGQEQLTL